MVDIREIADVEQAIQFQIGGISTPRTRELWVANGIFGVCAYDGGRYVGQLPLEPRLLEWGPMNLALSWITGFEILEDYRNRGIGRALIDFASEIYGSLGVYCEVGRDVYDFYVNCGFRPVTRINGVKLRLPVNQDHEMEKVLIKFFSSIETSKPDIAFLHNRKMTGNQYDYVRQRIAGHVYKAKYSEYNISKKKGLLALGGIARGNEKIADVLYSQGNNKKLALEYRLPSKLIKASKQMGCDAFRLFTANKPKCDLLEAAGGNINFVFDLLVKTNVELTLSEAFYHQHIDYI